MEAKLCSSSLKIHHLTSEILVKVCLFSFKPLFIMLDSLKCTNGGLLRLLLHLLSSVLLSETDEPDYKVQTGILWPAPKPLPYSHATMSALSTSFASHALSHLRDYKRKTGLSTLLGLIEDYSNRSLDKLHKRRALGYGKKNIWTHGPSGTLMCGRWMLSQGNQSSEAIRHVFNDNQYRYKTDMAMSFNKSWNCLFGVSDLGGPSLA